jgi:hypothetical protein
MSDELDELREAWQDQSAAVPRYTSAELQRAEARLQRDIRHRNLRELLAAAVVLPVFTALAFTADHPLSRFGSAWIALATLSIVWTLWRRGRPAPHGLAVDGLTWRRTELHRERELLGNVWRWYLGPLAPGMALYLAGGALDAHDPRGWIGVAVVCAALFAGVAWLNTRAVRAIDAELSTLGADPAP